MRRGIGFCLALVTLLFMVSGVCNSATPTKPSEKQINTLLRAVKAGDITFVKNALERDPTLANIENSHGIPPLMSAIFAEQEEIVKLLVSKGANVNAEFGPLGDAAYEGRISTVEYLISQGAEINGKDYNGHTPIFGAAEGGQFEVAKLLIARGAKVNVQGDFGATPLSTAVESRRPNIVKLLIDNGADVTLANEQGVTPLHKATSAYTATLLISRGAKVDAADEKGLTPLHMAAFYGRLPVAQVLIQKGAKPSAKTTATSYLESEKTYTDTVLPPGLTPREFAEKAGKTEVANLLAKAEAG